MAAQGFTMTNTSAELQLRLIGQLGEYGRDANGIPVHVSVDGSNQIVRLVPSNILFDNSNNVLTTSVTASVTNGAYMGFVIGRHAQACVSLTENPIEMYVKMPGSGGTSDPYNNITTVAYKIPYFGVQHLGFGVAADAFRSIRHTTAVSA